MSVTPFYPLISSKSYTIGGRRFGMSNIGLTPAPMRRDAIFSSPWKRERSRLPRYGWPSTQ